MNLAMSLSAGDFPPARDVADVAISGGGAGSRFLAGKKKTKYRNSATGDARRDATRVPPARPRVLVRCARIEITPLTTPRDPFSALRSRSPRC
jgi:hypothetical protein